MFWPLFAPPSQMRRVADVRIPAPANATWSELAGIAAIFAIGAVAMWLGLVFRTGGFF